MSERRAGVGKRLLVGTMIGAGALSGGWLIGHATGEEAGKKACIEQLAEGLGGVKTRLLGSILFTPGQVDAITGYSSPYYASDSNFVDTYGNDELRRIEDIVKTGKGIVQVRVYTPRIADVSNDSPSVDEPLRDKNATRAAILSSQIGRAVGNFAIIGAPGQLYNNFNGDAYVNGNYFAGLAKVDVAEVTCVEE